MQKSIPFFVLFFLAAVAAFFSNMRASHDPAAQGLDADVQKVIEQDRARIDLVMGYLITLQEKKILPRGEDLK